MVNASLTPLIQIRQHTSQLYVGVLLHFALFYLSHLIRDIVNPRLYTHGEEEEVADSLFFSLVGWQLRCRDDK